MDFFNSKNGGNEINLDEWTLDEVKKIVNEFKSMKSKSNIPKNINQKIKTGGKKETLEIKQKFLREEILEKGYDVNEFTAYTGSKNKGSNGLNLDNWTLDDLEKVVNEFKTKQSIPKASEYPKGNKKKLDSKEQLILDEIINNGYNRDKFDFYLISQKRDGANLNIWSYDELKEATNEFKKSQWIKKTQEKL